MFTLGIGLVEESEPAHYLRYDRGTSAGLGFGISSVAEWIHFTLFGIVLPTLKIKVYTFGAL